MLAAQRKLGRLITLLDRILGVINLDAPLKYCPSNCLQLVRYNWAVIYLAAWMLIFALSIPVERNIDNLSYQVWGSVAYLQPVAKFVNRVFFHRQFSSLHRWLCHIATAGIVTDEFEPIIRFRMNKEFRIIQMTAKYMR